MFKSFCGLFGGDAAPVSGSAHDFTVKDIDGVSVHMGDFKGKTLLVVNVASA
jgi:glutathione peroxidase-family protein